MTKSDPMAKPATRTWLSYIQSVAQEHCDPATEGVGSLPEALFSPTIFQDLFSQSAAVYVLDYRSGSYSFFSQNAKYIFDYGNSDFLRYGLDLTLDKYHPRDLEVYNREIFPDRLNVLQSIPPSQHKDYIFTYTFRFINAQGKDIEIMQRNCYILSSDKGEPLISMGMVINVNHHINPNIIVQTVEKFNNTASLSMELVMKKQYSTVEKENGFSRRELEILRHTIDGLTYKEIAARLFIAEGTVIQHRKNMLRKANAKNVAELVCIAVRKGYL